MKMKKKFSLKIASATENLEIIRDFIIRIALKGGFDQDTSEQIALAVDEACTNVIKHAHNFDSRRMIDISVLLEDDKIKITVCDKGKGFDVTKLDKPDLSKYIHESRKGGLGIHLMKTIMDSVEYNFNSGAKNQVILTKLLRKNDARSN
jgi:serine/threonine-protein kinase RsbW